MTDDYLRIDCDTCRVRGLRCGECVMSVLIPMGDAAVTDDRTETPGWDGAERAALVALAEQGLVPPLRHEPDNGDLTTRAHRNRVWISRASRIDPGKAVS